jgi:hypothetical protein
MNDGRKSARVAVTSGLEAIAKNKSMNIAEKINETYSFARDASFVYATGLGVSLSGICSISYVMTHYF